MRWFPDNAAAIHSVPDAVSALGDILPEILWLAGADGHPVYANPAWRAFAGPSSPGPDWRDAMAHPDDAARLRDQWSRASREAQPFAAECRFRRCDGEWRWFQDRMVPVSDHDGALSYWLGTLTDIHELKVRELALIAEARARDEYLATLGHELRTPLQALSQALYVLKLPEVSKEAAAKMHRTAENQILEIRRFCDDLRDVNSVRWDTMSMRPERVAVQAIVDDAVATASPQIQRHGHSLDVRVLNPYTVIRADRVRLAQALVNLLDNAAKYTPRPGRIVLTAADRGEDLELIVEDSGRGIDAGALPHIFDLFARGPAPSETGFGIGLALVRQVAMLHGGVIEASSSGPGQGSRFSLRIPAERSPET